MMTTNSNVAEQEKIKIIIADDHEIYRRGLTLFLEHEGMEVVDYAATGREAIKSTIKQQPDLLLLDIAMPDIDGLITLGIVKFLIPEMPVIILTALPDLLYLSRASDLGADGYFSKGVDNNKFANFIRTTVSKYRTSNGKSARRQPAEDKEIISYLGTKRPKNGRRLTKDEKSILKLISKGFDREVIAEELMAVSDRDPDDIKNMIDKF
jgi:DNA-binding NarL/FixJ family response regulator